MVNFLRHDLKIPIASFLPNDMAQNIAQVQWIDRWIFQSTDKKNSVYNFALHNSFQKCLDLKL